MTKIKREEIISEFSSSNALEIEWGLSKYHRAKGGEEYSKAIKEIQEIIGDSKVLRYPAAKIYNSWRTPVGWNLKGGFLKVVNPSKKYLVADLSLLPIAAIFMSGPSEGVENLRVIDVGKGERVEDYTEDVRGSAILANGDISRVYDIAVEKFGAKCVLSCFMRAQVKEIGRVPELLPQAINYTSFPAYADGKAFGFALSYDQYRWMKSLLRKRQVEIKTQMNVDRGSDELEVLETHVGEKTNTKPIVMMAHLCHPRPGANDNASGSALLVEIVRTLKKINLNREVVALWVPEMYGTAAYLTDHKADFELGINLDMVGEDQNKTGSTLQVSSTGWSLPSFVNDIVYANLETNKFKLTTGKYSDGSDHFIFSDVSVGVPTTSLTQWPDRFYHSSEDTPDKSSVESFEWIGKGVINTILDITYEMPRETAAKIQANILKEFVMGYNMFEDPLVSSWITTIAMKKLDDLSKYANSEMSKRMVKAHFKPFELPIKSRKLRSIRGPVADSWMSEKDREWFFSIKNLTSFWDFRYEFLNFMELGFSKQDAVKLAKSEFGIKEDLSDHLEYYLERLLKEKIIEL